MHRGVGGELPSIQRELLTQLSCLLWVGGSWGDRSEYHKQICFPFTKLMMMKVTLLWKAKGGPAFTDVAGGRCLGMLILAGASSRAHVALCAPGLLQKGPFESVFSSTALFSELIRTRDQRAGQAATLGWFHQFITRVTLSALRREGWGSSAYPDCTTALPP